MKKLLIILISLTGCAQYGSYRPTIDYGSYPVQRISYNGNNYPPQYNYPRQAYRNPQQDDMECQHIASQSTNTISDTLNSGGVTALGGAAAGAALGAILGNPGKGAAIGSVAGIGGALYGANNANNQYKRIYSNCLRNRGYNVLD
jgi:outer membrane lipoprotein SlyB